MFLAALAATAQTRMSVDSCMRYAANHNLDVRAARISLSDSRLDQQSALASTLPSVGAQIGAQFSFGRSIDPATNTYNNLRTFSNSYGLSISVPLFTGGSLVNDFRSARAAKRQAESEVDAQRDNASIAALDACVNLLYCQELSKIMAAKHRESLDALKQTRRMKELGLKSAVDLSQSEAQEADDDYCLTSALAQLRSAELKLKSAMNFPLADSLSVEMPATGAAMVSNGLLAADNPLLRQAEANVETQRLNALSARGRLMPSIFLNAGISDYYYSHQGQTNESFGRQMDVNFGQYVGVSVSIPLFDGLSRINGYRKARNRYVAAQIALERQRLQLDTDFSQAVIDRDNFAKEIVKMERKVKAGAEYFQTQAVFEPEKFIKFMEAAKQFGKPVQVGIIIPKSAGMCKFMNKNVAGVHIPDALIEELQADKEKTKAGITGVEIAARIIRECKPYCQGVHIMSLGWESKIPALLEQAGLK